MRDLKKEFTIPNGVNTLNATASLDPFYGPFESVEEAYDLVPENKRKVGKIFAVYLDSTKSNVELYYWITNSAGAEWRPIHLVPKINTDRVISLGAITVNGSVVTIGLSSGGTNSVEINNAIYSRYEPISFTTDPIIVAGNFRKDIIEARADSTVFYLKKGVESINPVPPAVTDGALFISEVLVTSTGVSAGALNSVVTDSTMKGDGTSGNPLGLSDAKNAEINGKISKQGIDLLNTADVPNMKIGNHNGVYRAYGASNPIQEYAPFLQMSVGDTYAQISVDQYSGALSYRAGLQNNPYSATRTAWDTGNLVNPATQTWVNQQKGIANGLATLNDYGVVPSSQLPSYVDDVIEVTNYGTLPTTGETGKIYVILNASGGYQANQQFRWSGGGYIALVASPGTTDNVPEGTNNKYYTDARVNAYVTTLGYATTTALNSKENLSNKVTAWSSTPNDTRYPSEKLVKDTINSLVAGLIQPLKVITSNTTLDDTYHNAIVRIESNVTINVPANLRNDFNCVFEAIGAVTGTFVATSPATISAPFGLILRDSAMATLYKYATNSYRLNGGTIPA